MHDNFSSVMISNGGEREGERRSTVGFLDASADVAL